MTNAHSIKTTLSLAATQLKTQGIEAETAKLEAQLLLQHAHNVNRAWLIAHENDALQANIHEAYRALINRRLNGEPIAYILGYREFYDLNLKVSPDTLIPRADTETLVEAALAKIAESNNPPPPSFPQKRESMLNLNQKMDSRFRENDEKSEITGIYQQLSILDLGTGTGAIALAIAKHRPQVHVTALDASQAALDIAIENAQNLNIPNVKFILSDWFSALTNEKFDVIVSNPPYIEQNDVHLTQGDLPWEPISALVAGHDGLSDIRQIVQQAPLYLNPHGYLMLEHGYNQTGAVAKLLSQRQFIEISTVKDLGGNDRVTIGRLTN